MGALQLHQEEKTMPTVELENHELRKAIGAVCEMVDYYQGKGNSGSAKEYRELKDKLSEAEHE